MQAENTEPSHAPFATQGSTALALKRQPGLWLFGASDPQPSPPEVRFSISPCRLHRGKLSPQFPRNVSPRNSVIAEVVPSILRGKLCQKEECIVHSLQFDSLSSLRRLKSFSIVLALCCPTSLISAITKWSQQPTPLPQLQSLTLHPV